ncbi:uncharacterized protein BDR25DRAFT_104884 [Lindgomyces ingoldianus]|uniref:Uncharacterized protein n=1 Tax=Lindgomyces ingoldianus TaxID=673940 RepID=A0ACB6QA83_9PLEO|nr:uncharacterized protein BDR25DRAFT_104884 [Lindgomyces ingoldianus]KAF2463864.1 hypothetical protein BDR25DRAFT_104884 [Lindgomyces ingoldianus]
MQMQSDKIRAKESKIQDLQRTIQADQQRRLQSSTRLREQEIRHREQERSMRDLQAQLDQLTKNLSDSYQRTEQLERAWKESTEEVAKLRQQSSVHKVDDNTLKATYGEVIYSVGNWASNYCGGRDASFHEADLLPLKSLTRHYRQYVSSEVLRPVLIQSLVMRMLVENILYSGSELNGLLWAGRLSPGLRLVQKALQFGDGYATQELLMTGQIRQSQVQEYSAWKAKSAILVAEVATEPDIDLLITGMQDRFRERLSPFVTCKKSEVWTDLREIIQTTVRLDKEIHMSRALFTFDRWSGPEEGGLGFEFDEEISASAQGFEPAKFGMKVELVVAPFFMKTGTGDGDAYETNLYLSKCVVVCTESRRKLENF